MQPHSRCVAVREFDSFTLKGLSDHGQRGLARLGKPSLECLHGDDANLCLLGKRLL